MTEKKITLIKSAIGTKPKMQATLLALGLKKIGQEVVLKETVQLTGMLQVVKHLIKVENV
jgi:large subunit ribosomal protein L30